MRDQYIYLIFSKTGTLLSNVLSLFSQTKYVHASISFDESFTQLYSFGRKDPYNPFSGGFVVETLYGGLYERFPRSECYITKVLVTQEQVKALREEITFFMEEREEYKYNFLGLFGILLNKPVKRKYYYFCSQFVSEILIKSGILSSDLPPELIRPEDLLFIQDQELHYKGFVNQCYSLPQLYNFTLKL